MMTRNAGFAAEMAQRDFSKPVIKALARKGIRLIDSHLVPDDKGSYAPGQLAYTIDDHGTARVRTYLQVLALAQ